MLFVWVTDQSREGPVKDYKTVSSALHGNPGKINHRILFKVQQKVQNKQKTPNHCYFLLLLVRCLQDCC